MLMRSTTFFGSKVGALRLQVSRTARSLAGSRISCGLKSGIVGLPNVGKSTLFNALTESAAAQAANFPFCTIEPNVGIVSVPDARLQILANISKTNKIVPAACEFVDIAGLVKGASKGEGLGNQFLSNIRECDAIVQVVRCFEDSDVIHVAGKVDPKDDADVINLELILSDITQIEKRLERLKKGNKANKDEAKKMEVEAAALMRIMEALEAEKPARAVALTEEEFSQVKNLNLLTAKPMIYAANVAEGDLADQGEKNKYVQAMRKKAVADGCELIIVSAQVESELISLNEDERKEFLTELGASEGGLGSLIRASYKTLGLQTYFTTGVQETRAWTIKKGFTAPQAAGVIHTDLEKGFICAETVAYDDFVTCSGFTGAKDKGKLRQEGKTYVMQEGDVVTFKSGLAK